MAARRRATIAGPMRPVRSGATKKRRPLGRTKNRPKLGMGLKKRVKAGTMSVKKARRIQGNRMAIRRKARRR